MVDNKNNKNGDPECFGFLLDHQNELCLKCDVFDDCKGAWIIKLQSGEIDSKFGPDFSIFSEKMRVEIKRLKDEGFVEMRKQAVEDVTNALGVKDPIDTELVKKTYKKPIEEKKDTAGTTDVQVRKAEKKVETSKSKTPAQVSPKVEEVPDRPKEYVDLTDIPEDFPKLKGKIANFVSRRFFESRWTTNEIILFLHDEFGSTESAARVMVSQVGRMIRKGGWNVTRDAMNKWQVFRKVADEIT